MFELFHYHYKIFAYAPECSGICDAQGVHSVCIFVEGVRTCRVIGEQFRTLGIKFYHFVNANVDFGEIVFVEIVSFKHLV